MSTAVALTITSALAVALLLLTQWRGLRRLRAPLKLAASSGFVALALVLDAASSTYGRWLLAALALGWLGDALLLSERGAWFMAGLVAFLLSHLCFGAAFVAGGVAATALAWSLLAALALGLLVWRWLRPHLLGVFRVAVPAYVLAILAMASAAAGHAAARGGWLPLAGALLFVVSDLAVARERFVARGFGNQAWGWPTYYAAQLLLAWTAAHPPKG